MYPPTVLTRREASQDVLIRPKRSTLKSRSEVSLERTFTFRNRFVQLANIVPRETWAFQCIRARAHTLTRMPCG